MNRIRDIRLIRIVAGLAGALVALGVAAPAAFARVVPPPGGQYRFGPYTVAPDTVAPVRAHSQVTAAVGMPGWQITLIAVGAAILAATLAVLVDRLRSARRLSATAAA
ncbi:MAG: hypothetical protein JO132_18980 [Streptosporangiaceae bacterium]|nr:hypothetical protein [Streptosporangiaceae bacterium]